MANYHISVMMTRKSEFLEVECSDHVALKIQVAHFVGDLLKERSSEIWDDRAWRIEVADERGLVLYVVDLDALVTPATMRPPTFE